MADFDDPFGFFPHGEDAGDIGPPPMDIADDLEGVRTETAKLEKFECREGQNGEKATAAQLEAQTQTGQPNLLAITPIDNDDGPEKKVADGTEKKTFYLLTHSWSHKGAKKNKPIFFACSLWRGGLRQDAFRPYRSRQNIREAGGSARANPASEKKSYLADDLYVLRPQIRFHTCDIRGLKKKRHLGPKSTIEEGVL